MARRRTYADVPTYFDYRRPIDFVGGYNDFVNRTVSNVVEQATPQIAERVTPIVRQSIFMDLLTIQTDLGRRSASGKGNSFNIQGLNLNFGQGLANIGGQYVVTNEAGRGGSTSAAKAILSSYNRYKSGK